MRSALGFVILAAWAVAGCDASPTASFGLATSTAGGSAAQTRPLPSPAGRRTAVAEDLTVIGDRVQFAEDRHDLSDEARRTLERQASWLRWFADERFMVEGHADERGTREYNLALGERRAAAVRDYLVALGIPPERLEVISYGKERPLVAASNEVAWAQNRRAVLVSQR